MEMILLWVWNNNQLNHFQSNTNLTRKKTISQWMYQQLYVQFKESKTLPTDYAPWENESCITDDVMRDKKNHFKIARMLQCWRLCNWGKAASQGCQALFRDPSTWTKINVVWVTFWHYGEFNIDKDMFCFISIHTGIHKQMPVMQINWVQTHMPN